MINDRLIKDTGGTGHCAARPWSQDDSKDGIVVPIGIGKITKRMAAQ
jgi:hypothetical protein